MVEVSMGTQQRNVRRRYKSVRASDSDISQPGGFIAFTSTKTKGRKPKQLVVKRRLLSHLAWFHHLPRD